MMNREEKLAGFYAVRAVWKEGDGYVCEVGLNPGHDVYRGHFPGMPVAPGVCLLYLICGCVSGVYGQAFRYRTIRSCKFLSAVNPLEEASLRLAFSLDDGGNLQAALTGGDRPLLKLKALLANE
ncbi:MAG: hydroxymyristoyl-ACP dehydratase [Tannerellaceae bacterium]|nr:hydroxymyristoyl-ACP dehydratase [Tannerellaceae bacterium]